MNLFQVTLEKFKVKFYLATAIALSLSLLSHYFTLHLGWEHSFLAGLLKFIAVCSWLGAILFFAILVVIYRFQKKASALLNGFARPAGSRSSHQVYEHEPEMSKKTLE